MQIRATLFFVAIPLLSCSDKPSRDPATSGGPHLWAVCVGIDNFIFTAGERNLNTAVNGATAMANILASPAFLASKGFAQDRRHIQLLLNQAATCEDIRSALSDSLKNVSAGDWVVFYFATHGERDPDDPALAHLICHDTQAIGDANRFRGTSIDMTFLATQLFSYGKKAERVVLLIDACRAGATITTSLNTRLLPAVARNDGPAITILTASTTDLAIDNWIRIKDTNYSAFTGLALAALQAEGGVDKPLVTFELLLDFIKRKLDGAQKPGSFGDLWPVFLDRSKSRNPASPILVKSDRHLIDIKPGETTEGMDEPSCLAFLLRHPMLIDFPYYLTAGDLSDWKEIEQKDGPLSKVLESRSGFAIHKDWSAQYKVIAANLAYLTRTSGPAGTGRLEIASALYGRARKELETRMDPQSRRLLCLAIKRQALCDYLISSRYFAKKANVLSISRARQMLLEARTIANTLEDPQSLISALTDINAGLLGCSYETFLYYNEALAAASPDLKESAQKDVDAALKQLKDDRERLRATGGWLEACVRLFDRTYKAYQDYLNKKLDPLSELLWLQSFESGLRDDSARKSPDFKFNKGTLLLLIGISLSNQSRWDKAVESYEQSEGLLRNLDQHPGFVFFRSEWQLLIQLAECRACLCEAYEKAGSPDKIPAVYAALKANVIEASKQSPSDVNDYFFLKPNEFKRLGNLFGDLEKAIRK